MGSKSIACKPALLNKPAELASTAATDVGMHGLLASQYRVTILCYPLVCVHCGPVVDFFITKQTSLHPFDFVRNLFHLLVSVQTLIFHLVVDSTRLKTVRSALWRCPNSTVALRLLENVVKVTNLEVVKIEFRHLPFLLSSSDSLAP